MSTKVFAAGFDSLLECFAPGQTVFLPGLSGESLGLYEALRASPERAAGVCFAGVHFPGINRCDYLALHPTTRFRGYFMSSSLRRGLGEGRAELLPRDYPGIYKHLQQCDDINVAVAQVSPPDAAGYCSLGIGIDFLPAVWPRARIKAGHINPRMPRTRGSFTIHVDEFDVIVEADSELLTLAAAEPDSAQQGHAKRVAALVENGDTLQMGVGKLPTAVARALDKHQQLKVFSGLITPPVGELVDAGVVTGVEAGIALGESDFYDKVAADTRYYFRPVNETHDLQRLAAIDQLCTINSAVEVDLFGQVNAESLNGRLVAGVGGLPVYVQAAQMSRGGRSIICLPSVTGDGAISRIVPRLGATALTAIPRHAVDYVVTEHGTAHLSGLNMAARTRALIEIAHPGFRDQLEQAWQQILADL